MGSAAWWQGATVYHIYPLSFADSNGDGFGDLPGITSRLGHLAGEPHSLGVDAIWLSPIYRSPMVDFGYDVSDHCDVDPRFGTLADADELIGEAHRRGLRVLLDFVPNHTSDQHPWFRQSRADRTNAYRDWYVWADPADDGGPPNNWLSAFPAIDRAWTPDSTTGQYYLHSYTPQQPDLNWRNPAVRAAMHDVLRFWLDRGVDGFRVDAPHRLGKDPALASNPPDVASLRLSTQLDDRRHRNIDDDNVHELLRGIRGIVDEYPDRVLVGEVGVRHPRRRVAYHGAEGDELHLLFDFGFWSAPWDAAAVRQAGELLELEPDSRRWPTHALSNHDIPRHTTRYGSDARARVAAVLELTLPGTAFLYYGEEIGMTDVAVAAGLAAGPDGRDPCRTPMQWDNTAPASAFTTGTPWLPTDVCGVDVASQVHDPGSLLTLYRRLLLLRSRDDRLTHGSYRALATHLDVYAYERSAEDRTVLVVLNFADDPRPADLAQSGHGRVALSTHREDGEIVDLGVLTLHADEATIIELPGH